MKALEKDRTRRYQTANALALDVRRSLNDEPVSAGPPSSAYRARKFVRRHRFGVATAAAFAILLVGVSIALAVQARRVVRERDRASHEAETSRRVSDFLVGIFRVADPGEARGNTITAREILDNGAAKIEQDLKGQDEIQGRLIDTMGGVYLSLGLYKASAARFRTAFEIRRKALGDRHPDALESLHHLGLALVRAGDLTGAETALGEALAGREREFGPDSVQTAETLRGIGELAYQKGDYARSKTSFDRALQIYRRLGNGQDEPIADCLNDIAMAVERATGDYASSKALSYEALEIRRRILPANHPKVAQSLNNVGMAHYRLREFDAAEPLLRESLAMNRALFGPQHPEVSAGLNNLALVRRERGDYAAAAALFAEVVEMDRRLLGPDHPFVATGLSNRAEAVRRGGDPVSAAALLRESLDVLRRTYGPDSWQIASTNTILARCLADAGRFPEAETLFLAAVPILEKQFGPSHPRVMAAIERGVAIYELWKKPDRAAEWRKRMAK
jgi:tetratricopeptide (TPR) repeat protein